jgi:hypothetical protein
MDDAAVVAALMACNSIFLFYQQQFLARKPSCNFERYSKADHASTDDDYVVVRIAHASGPAVMSPTASSVRYETLQFTTSVTVMLCPASGGVPEEAPVTVM